ncbi:MAG: alkaline phosphatase family protein [Actinomycetes bacterium]
MSRRTPRALVAMIDGLDPAYLEGDTMPALAALGEAGTQATVDAIMPTVTNVNNASICCAAWPSEHGITGNSYLDPTTGEAEYMEDAGSLTFPTLIERVTDAGGRAALLTAKVKSVGLLGRGATFTLAAEAPDAASVARYGPAPEIYSAEINLWLWDVAVDLVKNQPDLDLIYVHTTDYPMHAWPPGDPRSTAHLVGLDERIGEAARGGDDVAFFATADHGMNFKTRVWDLNDACARRGTPVRYALSAERDRYVKHHRTFGGTAWVWLETPADYDKVTETIAALPGIAEVMTRDEAAARFHLNPHRIGDLAVLGDRDTVFGELPEGEEYEDLPTTYRSHGSLHEQRVPLVRTYDAGDAGPARHNKDLLTPLLDGWLDKVG